MSKLVSLDILNTKLPSSISDGSLCESLGDNHNGK
ncbi:hypothetical protein NPD5_1213 [Clostridium sporogenes]|uniref:Uncharacterized protein n=1 Tax=Clostridium sporogenes TaxID=1509 RepID=A0A1L3NE39_CLOSG|nr:hypothetical protein NPD5_1213 [Clostridium sporogenes]